MAFCILFGTAQGAILGQPEAGVAYLIPQTFQTSLGAWTGTMRSTCALFIIIGPLVTGLLVEHWGLTAAGVVSGTSLFVAAILLSVALRMKVLERRRAGIGTRATRHEDIDMEQRRSSDEVG